MAEWIDLDRVLTTFDEYLDEFHRIVQYAEPSAMIERLSRWKTRVVGFLKSTVGEQEAEKFNKIRLNFDPYAPDSFNSMLESHRNALAILGEEIAAHPDKFYAPGAFVATRPPVKRLFISHAASDRPIAEYLRDHLLKARQGTEIFLASRPGHIRTGDEWWQVIQRELRAADAYVVLLTPRSINRRWIPFETGAAWMTGRPLFTVCTGDLDKAEIANPLAFFQVNSLGVRDEVEAFFTDLGALTEDVSPFCDGMAKLSAAVAVELEKAAGWVGVTVGNRYFAWEGPRLHSLPEWPPTPTPAGLIEAIREAGFTPSYGTRDNLTRHLAAGRLQVFESDRTTFQRPVLGGGRGEDQILLVRKGTEV